LGDVLSPWVARFEATVVVVGGSMVGSWDIIEAPLVRGISRSVNVRAERSGDPARSALIGADSMKR